LSRLLSGLVLEVAPSCGWLSDGWLERRCPAYLAVVERDVPTARLPLPALGALDARDRPMRLVRVGRESVFGWRLVAQ
jgi:hypothetical protein